MELAIPFIALGGLYVISNQNSQNQNQNQNYKKKVRFTENREEFTNMGRSGNYLPNTNIPPQNYPVTNYKELDDTVQNYPNPNTVTDKYFDQNLYEQKERKGVKTGNIIQDIYNYYLL